MNAIAPLEMASKLDLIQRGRDALAQAKEIPEIKHIRDVAKAVEEYQKQRDASIDAQNDAAELRLRAERRLGEVLAETEKHEGGRPVQITGSTTEPVIQPPRLSDLGVKKKQSMTWQQEAAIPEPIFEKYVEDTRAADEPLTTSGLLKTATKAQGDADTQLINRALEKQPAHAEAIRLADLARRWAHVHVWIREHLLPINPDLVAQAVPREQSFLDDQLAEELGDWFARLRDARSAAPRLISMNGGVKE